MYICIYIIFSILLNVFRKPMLTRINCLYAGRSFPKSIEVTANFEMSLQIFHHMFKLTQPLIMGKNVDCDRSLTLFNF